MNANIAKGLTVADSLYTVKTKPAKAFEVKMNQNVISIAKVKKLSATAINGQPVVTAFWGNADDEKQTFPMDRKFNESVPGVDPVYTDPKQFKEVYKALVESELQELEQVEIAIKKRRAEIEDQMRNLDAIINSGD